MWQRCGRALVLAHGVKPLMQSLSPASAGGGRSPINTSSAEEVNQNTTSCVHSWQLQAWPQRYVLFASNKEKSCNLSELPQLEVWDTQRCDVWTSDLVLKQAACLPCAGALCLSLVQWITHPTCEVFLTLRMLRHHAKSTSMTLHSSVSGTPSPIPCSSPGLCHTRSAWFWKPAWVVLS